MGNPYITGAFFQFLRDLKKNNDRDWFNANKQRYIDQVRQPLLDLISDFAPLLSAINPHYLAVPKASGGSLFRIYGDHPLIKDLKRKDFKGVCHLYEEDACTLTASHIWRMSGVPVGDSSCFSRRPWAFRFKEL